MVMTGLIEERPEGWDDALTSEGFLSGMKNDEKEIR
jgi:hypothetical protein